MFVVLVDCVQDLCLEKERERAVVLLADKPSSCLGVAEPGERSDGS